MTEPDLTSDAFIRIDLTHKLANGIPVWPGDPVFRQAEVFGFARGDIACNHSLAFSEHTGTHFDAPLHFVAGGRTIDNVPVERFFGRMVKLDVRDASPMSTISPERIWAFEAAHGAIAPDDAVMFNFGWDRYWRHPTDSEKFSRDWPGLSPEAAELLAKRKVRLVATDCMSIDPFGSDDYPVHLVLLGQDILIGENFTNLEKLPPVCQLVTLPLHVEGGSGAPVRAVALIPK